MVRFLAAVLVIGGAFFLGGVMNARSVRTHVNMAHAQDVRAVPQHHMDAHQVALEASQVARARSIHNAAELNGSGSAPAAPRTNNRFDRGRLSEVFDGEIVPNSELAPAQTEIAQESPAELAPLVGLDTALAPGSTPPPPPLVAETANDPFGKLEVAPIPGPIVSSPIEELAQKPAIHDEADFHLTKAAPDGSFDQPAAASPIPQRLRVPTYEDPNESAHPRAPRVSASAKPQTSPVRVTLVRTADHQIMVRTENQSSASESQKMLPAGAIAITAEEFSLTPSTEPGSGNLFRCSGRVEIRGQDFTAHCSKLQINGSDVLAEGTVEQPAVIVKMSKAAENNGGPTPLAAQEFRILATRISFTLSLDHIKVGDSVSVSPAVTPVPTPAAEVEAPPSDVLVPVPLPKGPAVPEPVAPVVPNPVSREG